MLLGFIVLAADFDLCYLHESNPPSAPLPLSHLSDIGILYTYFPNTQRIFIFIAAKLSVALGLII